MSGPATPSRIRTRPCVACGSRRTIRWEYAGQVYCEDGVACGRRMREVQAMTATVLIHNAYSDGHESEATEDVREPGADEPLDDWWEDAVYPLTGDGHGADSDLHSDYTATVIAAESDPLVGLTHEWSD